MISFILVQKIPKPVKITKLLGSCKQSRNDQPSKPVLYIYISKNFLIYIYIYIEYKYEYINIEINWYINMYLLIISIYCFQIQPLKFNYLKDSLLI